MEKKSDKTYKRDHEAFVWLECRRREKNPANISANLTNLLSLVIEM